MGCALMTAWVFMGSMLHPICHRPFWHLHSHMLILEISPSSVRSTEMTYGTAATELPCSLLFISLFAFICLFLAALGLCAARGFSLVVVSRAYSFLMTCRLLTAAASLVVEHGLWNLPRPGIKPMAPPWAGRFLATGPPDRSHLVLDMYGGLRCQWRVKASEWVTQSCPALCDPMHCSLPGFSVHGILQAGILEWAAISFSRGSSQARDQTPVSWIAGEFFMVWDTREAPGARPFINYRRWFC